MYHDTAHARACACMRVCWCRYRIGPNEVEAVLLEHAAVLDAAVVGSPDPMRGEVRYRTLFHHLLSRSSIVSRVS